MPQYTISRSPDDRPRPHLAALDGLRFVAAMHIVVFHTVHVPGWRLVTWGSTSTSFFFILSGFVLAYAYTGDGGRLRVPAGEFRVRRFERVYPLAVLTQLAVIPFAWSSYPPGERGARAAAALTGLQGWFPALADSFNSPGWSVSVFALCYLVFPTLASRMGGWSPRRLAIALAAVWLVSLAPTTAGMLAGADAYWKGAVHHHPLSRLPEFVFGVVLARLFVATPRARVPRGTAAAGALLLAAALLLLPVAVFPLARNGLLAPLHGLVIVGIAAGGGALARVLALRAFHPLGQASFAVFLLHVPLYAWVMMPTAPLVTPLPLPVRMAVYAGYLVLTVLTAILVQRYVADPIARALSHRSRPPGAAAGAPTAPAAPALAAGG